jgi:hypothetical protein
VRLRIAWSWRIGWHHGITAAGGRFRGGVGLRPSTRLYLPRMRSRHTRLVARYRGTHRPKALARSASAQCSPPSRQGRPNLPKLDMREGSCHRRNGSQQARNCLIVREKDQRWLATVACLKHGVHNSGYVEGQLLSFEPIDELLQYLVDGDHREILGCVGCRGRTSNLCAGLRNRDSVLTVQAWRTYGTAARLCSESSG